MKIERSLRQKFETVAIRRLCANTIIVFCLSILLHGNLSSQAQSPTSISLGTNLPPADVHPLPKFLVDWQDESNSGDYFEQIDPTPLKFLIWTQFPVKIFVQHPASLQQKPEQKPEQTAAERRFKEWVDTVNKAIADWQEYFPLQITTKSEQADIVVLRSQPQREATLDLKTRLFNIPRAVTAETKYKFHLQQNPTTIAHKMTVEISPNYSGISLLATARHEIGHALGIWGHSPDAEDALYFSQVSDPPGISNRDINTLKKIYQQPTKLGWEITN